MSHQAQVPTVVAEYFGISTHPDIDEHPIIEQVFTQGIGWKNTGFRKRVSGAWLRKLKKQGVTVVALRHRGRLADFSIAEILRGTPRERAHGWPTSVDVT